MDPTSRRSIEKYRELIKELDIDVLKPYLIPSRIFTDSMLADILDPNTEVDLLSELPSRGPHAFSRFLEVLCEAGYHKQANVIRNGNEYTFYPLKSQPLGYCIIINNINFYDENGEEDKERRREGSRVDARRLREFFEDELKYVVEERINLRRGEMLSCLEDLAKSEVMKIVDCFFVIILSHGSKGDVVFDSHFAEFQKHEVYKIFNNENCEYLWKKPKIFIFQACRGKYGDDGIFSNDSSNFAILPIFPNNNSSAESTDAKLDINPPVIINDKTKIPTLNDTLVIHSCLPDYVAHLDKYDGSWLIQDLLYVFTRDYLYQDVDSMLKTVSRMLQDRLSLKDKRKQVLHAEALGLRASLHICSNDSFKGPNKNLITYLS